MKKKIQVFLLAWFGFLGLVSGLFAARNLPEPTWWVLISELLVSVIIFYWYRVDSIQKEFRRPFLLSVGVVAIAPLAIPLYVFQSNECGLRLRALGRMLGYFCLIILVSIIGEVTGGAIG